MVITITPNDYQEVTNSREEVVQYICDAFLYDCTWSTFHPTNDDYRGCSHKVLIHKNGDAYGFHYNDMGDKSIVIRKCEVELAIKLLLASGYYLYRELTYGSWIGYKISKSPRMTGMQRVTEIRPSDWSGYFK